MKVVKKIISFIAICIITISYQLPILATTGNTITKQLYTKPSVAEIGTTGTNRGNWHDRQNLGIYMEEGASFEIRQTNLDINTDLTLDCLNNDSQTEKTYTIPKNGEWVTITVDSDSVPFIRTVYGLESNPGIEIKNLQKTQELTYYYYKDNEQEFFEKWENNNHSYAVIENDVATFLIPIKDRENIVKENGNNYDFKSIDELLEYYKEFVEQFDRFIGLSYDTEDTLNKNIRTKFFIKANKHGAGAAYYGGNHTAQNGDNISAYLCKGWLNIHELGHGYEGSLANQDLQLVDVMNNILAHYYQITFLNENDSGWLGKKINIEDNMKEARENITEFNELNYQQKLYMFVNLLDKIGAEESMAYVHSQYRKYISEGIQYNASDMFSKSFSEVSEYNVIPYLNSYKILPSSDIEAEIYEKELPMIYYLNELVQTAEKTEKIRKELGLDGKYDLVSNNDIAKYNMKGNATVSISIDNFEEIKGKKIYIKDGKNIVKEIVINDKNIKIENLAVGIYTLQLPSSKNEAYTHDYEYIVIKENSETLKEITYKKITSNSLASDTLISFRGLGDAEFAKVTMDLENKNLNIVSNNTQPHVYFNDEYANIQIYDKNEKKIYEKSYIGNIASPSNDIINIDLGYKIKIKHREAIGRLIFKSQLLRENEEFKNLDNNQTTYIITEYGLQKEGTTKEEQYKLYKTKLNKYIENLKNSINQKQQENKYNYFIQKNSLLSNIMILKEEDKEQYLSNNKVLINGSTPEIKIRTEFKFRVGDNFNIDFNKFKITDLEDGEIILNSENAKILHDIEVDENNKIKLAGQYKAEIIIADLDNNKTSKEFDVFVEKEEQQPSKEEKPEENEQQPSKEEKPEENEQQPSEEEKPEENEQQPSEEEKPEENEQQPSKEEKPEENEQQPSEEEKPEENEQQQNQEVYVNNFIKEGILPKTGQQQIVIIKPIIILVIICLTIYLTIIIEKKIK